MKKINRPRQDAETGEWRYNGEWYDYYPSEEIEKDEGAYDEYWDREYCRKRDDTSIKKIGHLPGPC